MALTPTILLLIGIFVNILANLYNFFMKLNAKELVKLIITKKCITQKELVQILNEKTPKKYTQDGLSRKLTKGTITFNEIMLILDILGYEIDLKEK